MEFIDGEDLASLIKRIGYLSNEKALDIARQLAAGLAAAHERGVLHRDLKPANIMLDGHGRVRITDFGLAIAVEDESQATEIAGTPAYMAPEQLAGKGATVRSDMYSLGLVLYEIYTGKKAFTATTLAELREQKETHTPRAISELREGMDPVVERLIRRCMEKDPNARPASVAQLALALPGGDPLAAAIAAGETPSPEMVAASGSREGLRPAVAWGILAIIVLGILAMAMMGDRARLHRRVQFKKNPDMLVERSHEILKRIGYPEDSGYSAYGFAANSELLHHIENSTEAEVRWKNLDPKSILFWYRQSLRPAIDAATYVGAGIGFNSPPLQFSGDLQLALDTEGRLVSFRALPPKIQPRAEDIQEPDWAALFSEAGLDISRWEAADPEWSPDSYADIRKAWQGSLPNRSGVPVRIESAAFQGKPVSFEIVAPWTRTARTEPTQKPMRARTFVWGIIALILPVIAGGIYFARRNMRLGRGDRRNALRLALFATSLFVLAILFYMPRSSPINLIIAPWVAGFFWILYIALEPFVRRRWPHILVSWTRLLSGEWRDSLIGRDALVGCALGVLVPCIWSYAYYYVPGWLGEAKPLLVFFGEETLSLETVTEPRFFVSLFLFLLVEAIFTSLSLLCLLFLLRIILRNQAVAIAACAFVFALTSGPGNYWEFGVVMVLSAVWFFVLMRFGLVAAAFAIFGNLFLQLFPITLDASAWYSRYGYVALAIFAAIVLYAFRTSLGGRPLLASSRLDE